MQEENLQTKPTENISIPQAPKKESTWKELLRFAIIAVIIVIPIRYYVAQPFIVNGQSMEPRFETGQYLIVDEISYELGNPSRNDVIIFKYPLDTTKYFIKRVIGLPGERVKIDGQKVTIFNKENPKGLVLDQSYIDPKLTRSSTEDITLASDEYFMMGDNRLESSDSRIWGPVKRNLIVGRAFLRLLPLNLLGIWPGKI